MPRPSNSFGQRGFVGEVEPDLFPREQAALREDCGRADFRLILILPSDESPASVEDTGPDARSDPAARIGAGEGRAVEAGPLSDSRIRRVEPRRAHDTARAR